jgi:hypothetical protein
MLALRGIMALEGEKKAGERTVIKRKLYAGSRAM